MSELTMTQYNQLSESKNTDNKNEKNIIICFN